MQTLFYFKTEIIQLTLVRFSHYTSSIFQV